MSLLVSLVERLLDIYSREPDAATRAVDQPQWASTDEISDEEANQLTEPSFRTSRLQLMKRTLIAVEEPKDRYPLDPIYEPISVAQFLQRMDAAALRQSGDMSPDVRGQIDSVDYREPLLRLFLSRLDSMAEMIGVLEDTEDFNQIPSQVVKAILREAHANFLFGMYASSVILFWTAIETALGEKLGSDSEYPWEKLEVWQKLNIAEERLYLTNAVRVQAEEVYKMRIDAVHNYEQFLRLESVEVGDAPLKARKVIAALYHLGD